MLPRALIKYRLPLVGAFHLVLIPLGYLAAFSLRFDFEIPARYEAALWATTPLLLLIRLASFGIFGVYRGWWRHVGMHDLIALIKAVSVSSAVFMAMLFLMGYLEGFPRSVLIIDWVAAIFLFGGIRFAVRGVREGHLFDWDSSRGKSSLIIGAGDAAEGLLRQVRRKNSDLEIYPLGLLDDDPSKLGMRLHGVPVLGPISRLKDIAARLGVKQVVIAIPSATREQMQRIVDSCIDTEIEFKIVPSLRELVDGRARVSQLRNVEIEDLLGREVIELDLATVERDIAGKVVLVTGGAGSIGSELARQVARLAPAELVLVEQAESALYFAHLELLQANPGLKVSAVVADVTDRARVDGIFAEYRPDYVFHAAAYKHVPLMESNIVEAVRNNVIGTMCVAECAARYGTDKFVLISTDKAVNPSSIMGATKRIAERIVLGWSSLRSSGTDFRAVRFGNVLGSDGSVVPLFRRQLAKGGPLTVTHPDVTRYFMTIPEAVQLVLQAASLPEATRRIAMLDMGEPVRILDVAENLIRLSGLEPYRGIPIVFTGLRPGEKLQEELMSDVEATVPTTVEKIRIVQTDEADSLAVERGVDRLIDAAGRNERQEMVAAICALVPECVSPLREHGLRAVTAPPKLHQVSRV